MSLTRHLSGWHYEIGTIRDRRSNKPVWFDTGQRTGAARLLWTGVKARRRAFVGRTRT
jgi:hypothetical protein